MKDIEVKYCEGQKGEFLRRIICEEQWGKYDAEYYQEELL